MDDPGFEGHVEPWGLGECNQLVAPCGAPKSRARHGFHDRERDIAFVGLVLEKKRRRYTLGRGRTEDLLREPLSPPRLTDLRATGLGMGTEFVLLESTTPSDSQ